LWCPSIRRARRCVDLSGSTTEDWSSSPKRARAKSCASRARPPPQRQSRGPAVVDCSIAATCALARSPPIALRPSVHTCARYSWARGQNRARRARRASTACVGQRARAGTQQQSLGGMHARVVVPCMLGSLRPPVNEAWQLLLAGRAAFTESWDAAHVCNTVFVVAPLVVLSSPPAATPTHRGSAD
jgi:hypothetical protein